MAFNFGRVGSLLSFMLIFALPGHSFAADPLTDTPWKIISKFAVNPLNEPARNSKLELKAKATVVIFWASWCEFCKTELSHLRRDSAQWNSSDAQVIGLSIEDDRAKAEAFESGVNSKFPMWTVVTTDARKKLAIPKLPMTLVLNFNGDVKGAYSGFTEDRYQLILKSVKAIVKPGQHD